MSSTYSDPATVTATFDGVWLHDPDDPAGTLHNFRYGRSSRAGSLEVAAQDNQYAGRVYPVTDFGPHEREQVQVEATSVDPADLDALRRFIRARKPAYYRDNRGRAFLGRLTAGSDRDENHGSTLSFTVSRSA